MTIFDLVQSLKRQASFIIIGLGALVLFVAVISFDFGNGGFGFRFGPRYESGVQMAVLSADVDSLAVADVGPGDFSLAAQIYGEMLKSPEAETWIGERAGFQLGDPLTVTTSTRTSLFSASVIAPTEEQAKSAAIAAFEWLEMTLQQPLDIASIPQATDSGKGAVVLDGPFSSSIEIVGSPSLLAADPNLFLTVDSPLNSEFAALVTSLGDRTSPFDATLQPNMTIVMSLQTSDGAASDPLRLQVPTLPQVVTAIPVLSITIDSNALSTPVAEGVVPQLDPGGISIEWVPRINVLDTTSDLLRDTNLVLITTDPIAVPIGQRRGPIVMMAATIVGLLVLLVVAMTRDSWQQERARVDYEYADRLRRRSGWLKGVAARRRGARSPEELEASLSEMEEIDFVDH